MQLFKGETVTVVRKSKTYVDGYPETREDAETVENVLVHPGATSDLGEGTRTNGSFVGYTLCFPKTYERSLRGASVIIDGRGYEVIGDPRPCLGNCPTPWNRNVEVSACEG